MSEYQYYEFQALDKPLSSEAREEMQRLSSRVQLTATSASFVYHYGNFRGTPSKVLAEHFDAMLYITNWGTRQLMFRFPSAGISADVMQTYQYADSIEWSHEGEYVILNIERQQEDFDDDWLEGEGTLSGIVQVRQDILHGDYRALYLAWLAIASEESQYLEDDDEYDALTEPPVPPNLGKLTPSLRNFIEFFLLDPDVVASAAKTSPNTRAVAEDLSRFLDQLPLREKDDFLKRLLRGERHLDIALTTRLRAFSGTERAVAEIPERRTLKQIFADAEEVHKKRLDHERQAQEAQRLNHLQTVAKQEEQLWERLPALIEYKQANTYDKAVTILKDLRDLAKHEQRLDAFHTRLKALRDHYPTLRGFHSRLRDAGIIKK